MRWLLLVMLAGCQREERQFEAAAADRNAQSLAPQGTLAAGGAPLVHGAELDPAMPTYVETAQNVNEGKFLYQRMNCVGCHHYGGGGIGPAFMDSTWRYGSSPGAIATSIIAGRKDGMPSYRGKLTGVEVGQLVAYVRSLGDLVRTDAVPSRDEHIKLSPAPTLEDLAVPHGSKP